MVDIELVRKLEEPVTLERMREIPELEEMALLKRGQRLSVQPVTEDEWNTICKIAGVPPAV
jgi:predicted RNA-binding protein with PUA-like domain